MEMRFLGRTGIRVTPMCLGCMMFGGRTSADDSAAIIDKALAAGINFLDTANVYNDGKSEEVTGEALKKNGHRHHIVLATKVHGNMHKGDGLDPNQSGNSRRQIIEQCEASLKRLKTDWIDLYQIHRPQPECPIDETLRALDDLVRAGKVRYIGTSTFGAWQVVESLWVSDRYGLNRFVTEQPPYNLLDRRIERELIPACKTYGFGIIPWSPLGGGMLTGKYKREGKQPDGGRFSDGTHFRAPKILGNNPAFDVVDALQEVARRNECTISQLAVAWVMQRDGITSAIIGPRTMEQFEDNLKAFDVKLSEEDLKRIDEIVPPGSMTVPFYEASFGPHSHRW
ncbi:MAG TPA: aldo/keto reductase [Tepidisphaeraceae bacterium]|jgi:aryl-alcohol dehydrogenase-like predicted oxidoreductase